jgi:hypothetical protein
MVVLTSEPLASCVALIKPLPLSGFPNTQKKYLKKTVLKLQTLAEPIIFNIPPSKVNYFKS